MVFLAESNWFNFIRFVMIFGWLIAPNKRNIHYLSVEGVLGMLSIWLIFGCYCIWLSKQRWLQMVRHFQVEQTVVSCIIKDNERWKSM